MDIDLISYLYYLYIFTIHYLLFISLTTLYIKKKKNEKLCDLKLFSFFVIEQKLLQQWLLAFLYE